MATILSEELDGANGTNVITAADSGTQNVGLDIKTGGWTFDTSTKASGTSCATNTVAAPNTAALTKIHTPAVSLMYYDVCFRYPALPAAEQMLMQLRSGGTNRAQVMMSSAGVLRIRNGTTQSDIATVATVMPNQWFRVKWGVGFSVSGVVKHELRIYTSASPSGLFGVNPVETLQGNYTQGSWDRVVIGNLLSVDATIKVDRIVIDDATWPASGGSGNVAPVANAGPDQDTVIGGDTVTLTGAASSDSDGTITDYAWTQVSGPTITLSNPAVVSPTFVAPDTGGTAVFGLRVTDNSGSQSTQDTVTITWSDKPANVPTSDFYELFESGAAGATITGGGGGNTAFDSVDTGWTFDATVVGDGKSAKVTGTGGVKILTHILPAGLVSSRYLDAIFRIDSLANAPYYIMRVMSSSTLRGTVRIDADGGVRIRAGADGATAVGTATTSKIVAGQPFRIAWFVNNGGTTEARLFLGSDLFNTASGYTDRTSGSMSSGTFDRVGFGIAQPAVTSGTIYVDTVQVEASTWAEPFGGTPAVLSEVYQMDNTTPGTWQPLAMNTL